MKQITFFILCLLSIYHMASQQRVIKILWADMGSNDIENQSKKGDVGTVPFFYESGALFYSQWEDRAAINEASLEISDITYGPIPNELRVKMKGETFPTEVSGGALSRKAREKFYTIFSITPIVRINGQLQRVLSCTVTYRYGTSIRARQGAVISNSVLSSGDFYKFHVEKTGVHRLDRNFLNSIGFSTSGIDPRTIKIYGHGGAPLPFRNSENLEYDIPENAIKVVGEADGSFDSGDYILFYGEATEGWHPTYGTHINPYADRSYYYITAGSGTGKRVAPMSQPSGEATTTFTTFEDYQWHEEDLESLVKVGRRWFGERFSFENELSFDFNFPNVVGSEMARLRVVCGAISESVTSFDVAVNGVSVGTIEIASITDTTLARGDDLDIEIPITSQEVTVTLTYNNSGNPASTGYLDYISLDVPRALQGTGEQIAFKKNAAATTTGIANYTLTNAGAYSEIWDVTDPRNITALRNENQEDALNFKATLGEVRDYIAVTPNDFFNAFRESGNTRVPNQNLKGTIFNGVPQIDYLMITGSLFKAEAERLAQFNRAARGLQVKVVTLDEIYEEFSSGKQDIGAIRNFVKYVYDNAPSEGQRLKYLCLFGDASVDYKNRLDGNTNFVPTFQAFNSFSLVNSYMSDDFFGFMDAEEGVVVRPSTDPSGGGGQTDKLDIAVGRIVVDNLDRARIAVDKIINYEAVNSQGRWRTNFVLISDDVDVNWEFRDLEQNLDLLGDQIVQEKPFVNLTKIHSDAFLQQASAGGDRYPEVKEAIADALEVGSLVVTYLGHGGEDNLAKEVIFTQDDAINLSNGDRLPVLVTVTCEYTKFDNPLRDTGGEQFFWNRDGGAVGLVTTTREIGVQLAVTFNDILAGELFAFGTNDLVSVAENLRVTKNAITDDRRRVIFYVGDPAMKLKFPEPNVRLDAINDIPVTSELPTLRALDRVTMSGSVTGPNGAVLTDYTGNLAVTLYDKLIERQTLGNDGIRDSADYDNDGDTDELLILDFTTLGAILYRGQASVENGQFEFEFVMPRDTQIPVGSGRLSFYASKTDALEDQAGANTDIIIGGLNTDAPADNQGPRIQLFMNDDTFVNGGITDDSPFIFAKLSDENGINTASGIGHDMIAILDGDEANPIVMNDFYEANVDDFTQGEARRRIRDLEEGLHTLRFVAWDTYNNSSTAEIQFVVAGDDKLELENVLNYPNPFVDYTEFWFNHNRPFEPLEVQIQIFTISGKVVKTINQTVTTDGFLSRELTWDGRDDFGQRIGKGTYVYKITVRSTLTNKRVEKYEKLVIL